MTAPHVPDAEVLARIDHHQPHRLDGAAERGRESTPTAPPQGRSPRQQAILALPEMADPGGVKPSEIAAATHYSVTNTYGLLQALHRAGLVETVPGQQPQRWRFTTSHRHEDRVFCQLAGVVRSGEWTTCGDLSLASRGDTAAAATVCLVATRNETFPAAHRVLLEGGEPHPQGHEHQRPHPNDIRNLLRVEGIHFDAQGRAPARSRVTWDILRERARQ